MGRKQWDKENTNSKMLAANRYKFLKSIRRDKVLFLTKTKGLIHQEDINIINIIKFYTPDNRT